MCTLAKFGSVLIVWAAVGWSSGVSAQTLTTARIAGTITDIQGAAVVNAEITAEDTSTAEVRKAPTDAFDDYVLA